MFLHLNFDILYISHMNYFRSFSSIDKRTDSFAQAKEVERVLILALFFLGTSFNYYGDFYCGLIGRERSS